MPISSRIRIAAIFAGSALLPIPAGAVNLLTNGSFENPGQAESFITHTGSNLTGWSITSGSVDTVTSFWVTPTDGTYALDLDGVDPGTIEQTFSTVIGNVYNFSIDILGSNGAFDSADFQITGNTTLFSETYSDTTGSPSVVSGTFTADSTLTTLRIISRDENPDPKGGLFVDNAIIEAIPEPSTTALIAMGAGLSFLRRRSSDQT